MEGNQHGDNKHMGGNMDQCKHDNASCTHGDKQHIGDKHKLDDKQHGDKHHGVGGVQGEGNKMHGDTHRLHGDKLHGDKDRLGEKDKLGGDNLHGDKGRLHDEDSMNQKGFTDKVKDKLNPKKDHYKDGDIPNLNKDKERNKLEEVEQQDRQGLGHGGLQQDKDRMHGNAVGQKGMQQSDNLHQPVGDKQQIGSDRTDNCPPNINNDMNNLNLNKAEMNPNKADINNQNKLRNENEIGHRNDGNSTNVGGDRRNL